MVQTSTVDPLSLDFAALRTLCLVEDSGSFTAAAQVLGVNQSAVSYTIDRLRAVFHDPLFVREKGRQIATARCQQIMDEVRPMLTTLDRLARPEAFDPAQAQARFRLACNYYERLLIVPHLVALLREQAPGISLEVVNSRGRGPEILLHGGADMLIGPRPVAEGGIYVSRLWAEDYVCLMDPAHPAAAGPLRLDIYLTLDLIDITYEGNWTSPYLVELERSGHAITPALKVPSPAGVARLVAGSTLVATIPRRLAHEIGEGLRIVECPVPGGFDITLVWPPRVHADAMHQWMRGQITGLRRQFAGE
ncbi:LysR family transcriptional regulator [Paracoccus sp. TK19116]|uniref:LysR family transcriptional regulator n=1 Tax=Paracoccus albicereus TaxID=2922394 RepID=A0ABT1MQQ2_9RHOB|nr:LysR family transcriptional regulator [Paracoccus albicereus]MCQ0970628.1 LysR family transcriptional regulator [Paracoccus albicereus]